MWYSCLSRSLPENVEIDGVKYGIRYGFRTMIAVEMLMYEEMSDDEKMERSLSLFFQDDIPENVDEAVKKLLWFHHCGLEEDKSQVNAGKTKYQKNRAYDFKQDADMIYAAFLQQYNINLHRIMSVDLHWWEFSALFESLSDSTKMGKVMYWRTCDIKGMSKNEQRYIKEMKKIFAIKETGMSMIEKMESSRERLARRNAEMADYIRRRYEECQIR